MANKRYPLERPAVKAKVLALVAEGRTDGEIAAALAPKVQVSRQAIHAFRKRHDGVIGPMVERIVSEAKEFAIAHVGNRVREYAGMYGDLEEYQQANGLEEVSVRYDKNGDVVGETKRLNSALLAHKRGILRDVAEEMGDISRAAKVQVNVDNRQIRVYDVGAEGDTLRTPRTPST